MTENSPLEVAYILHKMAATKVVEMTQQPSGLDRNNIFKTWLDGV